MATAIGTGISPIFTSIEGNVSPAGNGFQLENGWDFILLETADYLLQE